MNSTRDLYPVIHALENAVATIRAKRIDLTDGDMVRGRGIASEVSEAIERLSGRNGFPILVRDAIFTAGSFGRRTQAQPLDDIDLFIPLDAAALVLESPSEAPTAETLVSRNVASALGCRRELNTGRWNDSGKTVDLIVTGLPQIELAATDIGKNARGRCAHLTYRSVNVDLVFVLWSEVSGSTQRFHLPSGAGPTWRTANPKDDQRRLSNANQHDHNGLLLPTVRALKAWNDHACGGRLKSIHLEVLATEVLFSNVAIGSVLSALTHAFHELPTALGEPCQDPTHLGPDLDANLHDDDRRWVQQHARHSAETAIAANASAEAADISGATDAWERILLTKGPPAPERGRADPEPGWHNDNFGQPAHHCDGRTGGPVAPPVKAKGRPTRPANQQVRRDYG